MDRRTYAGNLLALFTIVIWGSTFVSTKILLRVFSPVWLLVVRFALAWVFLAILKPPRWSSPSFRTEWPFILLGLTGITLYFWTENLALHLATAANVGLIVAVIPLMTAVADRLLTGGKNPDLRMLLGFVFAATGIFLILFHDKSIHLDPWGDLLALGCSVCFAIYSVILKAIDPEIDSLQITRKTFFYGTLGALPILVISRHSFPLFSEFSWTIIGNLLFLVILASGLCYVFWSRATKILGPVRSAQFIYLVPLVSTVCAGVVLGEPMSPFLIGGGLLIVGGVLLGRGFGMPKTA